IDQPLDAFEPEMFGISPREAMSLDPQQRLLLEVSWEALERAGIAPDRLAGSDTGVYIGMISGDYGRIPFTDLEPADLPYYGTGNAISFEAGRISYVLGLQGPSMVVATACSSTLVTTHLAAQALRNGECDLALSGGVSLMVYPDTSIILSQMRATAPDGRSKTFDAAADGFGRGEGCGMIVLKRLGDAQRDGDMIHAVIRGSAVNHDGASGGITVPNGPAQEKVLRRALAAGEHDPAHIDVIEAHGTGTPLGDPIELIALGSVLGVGRSSDRPLTVGSVKTNIGHLEAAAGVAGVMKLALAMQHEVIPPHRNLDTPNPHIPWDELPIRVVTEPTPWPRGERPRLGGVSSFGLSGINAHVILQEAPSATVRPAADTDPAARHVDRAELLLLSARTDEALEDLAHSHADLLDTSPSPALADVCAAAARGRARMTRRLAVIAPSPAAAAAVLRTGQAGEGSAVVRGVAAPGRSKTAFLFTGQGAQHPGMGRGLYDSEAVFAATVDHCDALLREEHDLPLLDLLYPADPADDRVHQTVFTQPALFVVELALARLWEAWGVRPDIVIGHSIGEYAAAVVAGILDPDEALGLVVQRGRRMQAVNGHGAMATIAAAEDAVRAALSGLEDAVSVAAVNGPRSVVISGDRDAVTAVRERFAADGAWTRELVVSHAFHSPHMDDVAAGFADVLAGARFAPARIPIVGNLDGTIDGSMAAPGYWARQIRGTVRFADGMATLGEEGVDTFIEIGPRPVLTAMGQDTLDRGRWLASLNPRVDDRTQMLHALGALVVGGGTGDLDALYPAGSHPRVALPTYPFQRRSFWLPLKGGASSVARPSHQPGEATSAHPLLGRSLHTPGGVRIVETVLQPSAVPWLRDHRVYGRIVVPATAFVEMALSMAAAQSEGHDVLVLRDVQLVRPLAIPEEGSAVVQIILQPPTEGMSRVEVHSQDPHDPDTWRLHASGLVGPGPDEARPADVDIDQLRASCDTTTSVAAFYAMVGERGIDYGPAFRALRGMQRGRAIPGEGASDVRALGEVVLGAAESATVADHLIHPVLLDACLQALGSVFGQQEDSAVHVPVGIDELIWHRQPGAHHWVQAVLPYAADGRPPQSADFTVLDGGGAVVVSVRGLRFKRAPRSALLPDEAQGWSRWLFVPAWTELPALGSRAEGDPGDPGDPGDHGGPAQPPILAEGTEPQTWLVLGEGADAARGGAHGDAVARGLALAGARVILAHAADGATLERNDDGTYLVDPADPTQIRRLLRDVGAGGDTRIDGIAHLWSCRPAASSGDPDGGDVSRGWRRGAGGLLHLVQAIATEVLA
ncbi:MAG TPA: type I polyketide synthase, partial [Euzebya sp.]|nr:type I polyketide synthase [Euzebya sp.]